MDDSSLYLKAGQSFVSVTVHPVVIVSILDHFIRRNEGHRVIGTLLGTNNDGAIEIRNCFPVPHTEGTEVGVDMDFHNNMLELHHRVSPKETIVGWYATGGELNENSAIIHEYFVKKLNHSPIHLNVDTNLTNCTMTTKAYTNVTVTLNEKQLGTQFLPVPCDVISLDSEKIGVDTLLRAKAESTRGLLSDLESLETSIRRLQNLIDSVSEYVNRVLEGKLDGDANVGRFLASSISALPKIDPPTLEKMFNNSIQDLLLVVYLANLTRTQLHLAEKLKKVA